MEDHGDGMESMMVVIVDYRPEWTAEFEIIATMLKRALGPLALRIDHIGSTAVPGLSAKDVIDVQITVTDLNFAVVDALKLCGFVHKPEIIDDHIPTGCSEAKDRWSKMLVVEPIGARRANIHIRCAGWPNQRYALLFRDYLKAHPAMAASYAELKRRLAVGLADPKSYPEVKDPAVDLIYFAAEAWASLVRWHPESSDSTTVTLSEPV